MNGKIFLIHWNEAEAQVYAEELRQAGWDVATESQDGARAYRLIRESLPHAIVINLTRLPSHGRETADALRSYKATRRLPIIFVDGKPEAVEKTKAHMPDAIYIDSTELNVLLMRVIGEKAGDS